MRLPPRSIMHLTVGVGPPISALPAEIDVGLPLVKAALLYGDRVTLCSPSASLLVRLQRHHPASMDERLDVLTGLSGDLGLGDAPARLRALLEEGRLGLEDARPAVDRWWARYRAGLREALAASGFLDLEAAVAAGRLEVETLGVGPVVRPSDFARAAAETYASVVRRAVASGDTVPLVDGPTAHVLRRAVMSGQLVVSRPRIARSRDGGLAADVLHRLPLFDRATVAEVLDIRTDLGAPLARFRAAISEFSGEVSSAAWDTDFSVEAARIYQRRVAPAIADIEDAVASVGYLRELTSRYAERPQQFVPLAAPLLTVAVTSSSAIVQAVSAVLSGLSVGANAGQAWLAARDARRDVEARRLFFVYAAGRRLRGLEGG